MRVTAILFAALISTHAASTAAGDPQPPTAYERMLAEVRGLQIPERVEALVHLAWPDGPADEEVAAVARAQLLDYGPQALPGLRQAILSVPAVHQADVVATLIENQKRTGGPISGEFAMALEQALWFGDSESKRLTMKEAARRRYAMAVLPITDAVIEYPELTEDAVECLGRIGDPRARFFLADRLQQGSEPVRLKAAVALARIGGPAREPLREAALSDDPALRTIAIQSLLSSATPEDLYVFHDFVARYGQADPATAEAVRAIAIQLEEYLARQQPAEDVP